MAEPDPPIGVRAGRLCVEGCDAEAIAARFGTPLHVVSETALRLRVAELRSAFEACWPDGPVLLVPSFKANLTLALRRILNDESTGCDVFGASELEAALRCGVPPGLISLNGGAKHEALIERAARAGVRVTLDSAEEFAVARSVAARLGTAVNVRFRLRPDLAHVSAPSDLFAGEVTVAESVARYKPGIPLDDLLALGAAAVSTPGVAVRGLMVHTPRHVADPSVARESAGAVAALVVRLRDAWAGWLPEEIDLGGGIPAAGDPVGRALPGRAQAPPASPVGEFAQAMAGGLRDGLLAAGVPVQGMRLEVEPGRGLYGDAGLHLTRVRNVKREAARVWVEVDTSEAFLPDVLIEHDRFPIVPAAGARPGESLTADVVGISCGFDLLAGDERLSPVEVGDVLAFMGTGAYQDAASSNFNALPRPGTVLVCGERAELVKRAETVAEVFARDVIPVRLGGGDPIARAIDHVSVTVESIERSVAFYSGLLGLPVRGRSESGDPELAEITGVPAVRMAFADLALPDGRLLELVEYLEPRGQPLGRSVQRPGAGHISLLVDDADAAHRRLLAGGVAPRSAPVLVDDDAEWRGVRLFYAEDPDGYTLEFIERPS